MKEVNTEYTEISPFLFKEMVIAAYQALDAEKDYINSLNIFPVPDGDTGTNMSLTMKAAVEEINKHPCLNLSELSELVANQCLLGARGNSGMILASFFKGFARSLNCIDRLDISSLTKSIIEGTQSAYQSVRNPVEGTILTVMNAVAKNVRELSPNEAVTSFFEKILETAIQAQKQTPELLPQLKQAGVVDAGGYGFVNMLEAFVSVIKGKKIEFAEREKLPSALINFSQWRDRPHYKFSLEFFIKGDSASAEKISSSLTNFGNSLIVSQIKNRVRVHIHTNVPDEVKRISSSFGRFFLLCKNDMLAQHKAFLTRKKIGIVIVSPGRGFTKIFTEYGADAVITFSRSKPSVEELIKVCRDVKCQSIILLPNDRDILTTALHASCLVSKKIHVLPTKTASEGIGALISFDQKNSLSNNLKLMKETFSQIKSGIVARAIRPSRVPEFTINKKDFIGIYNGQIQIKANDLGSALLSLLAKIVDQENEAIMIYRGKWIRNKKIEEIKRLVESHFSGKNIQWYYGGQLYYQFIVGII